jgi:hypothetical protein
MNKKEKTAYLKRELADLSIHKRVLYQGISTITSRESYLKTELDSLGASNSTRKGKYDDVLTEEQNLKLIGGLTR